MPFIVAPLWRMAGRLLTAFSTLLLASCASWAPGPVRPGAGAEGSVAIIALDRTPQVRIEGFSGGRLHGFATGMESTFGACVQIFGQGSCVNSGCGALVLFLLGTCGTASVVGGIVGALSTEGDFARQAAASGIDRALNTAPAQRQLRDRILAVARRQGKPLSSLELEELPDGGHDYRGLQWLGIDTLLEVELTRVGTEGPGGNAPSQLYMEARVRMIRVADRKELSLAQYRVIGHRYSTWEWQANNGQRLLEGFQLAYDGLAERIYAAHLRH